MFLCFNVLMLGYIIRKNHGICLLSLVDIPIVVPQTPLCLYRTN